MRIAIICPSINPSFLPVPAVKGGAIEQLVQLIIDQNEVMKENLEIDVISAEDEEAKKHSKKYKKTRFYWIPYSSIKYMIFNTIIRILRRALNIDLNYIDIWYMKKIIKHGKYNAIVIEGNVRHAFSFVRIMRNESIFFHIHANVMNRDSVINSKVVAGCKKIIVVSKFIGEKVMKINGADANKIVVLKNSVDLSLYEVNVTAKKKMELRNKYGIAEEETVLMFAGRVIVEKGVVELFKALTLLPKEMKYKLIVAGSYGSNFGKGRGEKSVKKIVKASAEPIKDKVIFTGYIKNEEMHNIHSICHVAVVPSICEEAAGLVAVEAMASGLPLIVTNSGGLPEYVKKDYAIMLNINEKLVYNLSKAIEKLVIDKKLRKMMGVSAKKFSRKYKQKLYYEKFIEILKCG